MSNRLYMIIFLLCPLFFVYQNSNAEPAKNANSEQVISADSSQAKSSVKDSLKTMRKYPIETHL